MYYSMGDIISYDYFFVKEISIMIVLLDVPFMNYREIEQKFYTINETWVAEYW